jgi:hypothetical protein
LVASFGSNSSNTRITHNMPQPPTHFLGKCFPYIKWMVDPSTLGISCAFIRMIPFLDRILTSLLCLSMSTLLRVMNSIHKMQSIWRTSNSLRDSNVSPKLKTTEKREVGAAPWFAPLRRVKGCGRALGWD